MSAFTEDIISNSYWDLRSQSIFSTGSAEITIKTSLKNGSVAEKPEKCQQKKIKDKHAPTSIYYNWIADQQTHTKNYFVDKPEGLR